MADDTWPNLVTMFFRQADRFGERPLLWHKREGRYAPLTWREVMARGERDHANIRAAAAGIERTETACIIYTSGTGGAPKGVMLHHGAILSNIAGAIDVLGELGLGDEVFLSFLPLSHAYEHTVGQFLPIALGSEIYYPESLHRVAANLREARPTILVSVPRFYEVLHQRILHDVRKEGGLRQRL